MQSSPKDTSKCPLAAILAHASVLHEYEQLCPLLLGLHRPIICQLSGLYIPLHLTANPFGVHISFKRSAKHNPNPRPGTDSNAKGKHADTRETPPKK